MNTIGFLLKKILTALVMPPTSLLLLALLGLLLFRRWPIVGKTFLWLAVVSLLVLSLPITEQGLNAMLAMPRFTEAQAKSAQAIVVLGGGMYRATPEYGDTPSQHSLARLRYGAMLAKRYQLPVLVTGGQVYGGQPEADVMAAVLRNEFGVEVRWLERASKDTQDNLRFSASMLQPAHVDRVLLVTEDFHMMRAMEECLATSLHCYAAPVTTDSQVAGSWIEGLPQEEALERSEFALHELLGLWVQRLR